MGQADVPYFGACDPEVCVGIHRGGESDPSVERRCCYERSVQPEPNDFPHVELLLIRQRLLYDVADGPYEQVRGHTARDRVLPEDLERRLRLGLAEAFDLVQHV